MEVGNVSVILELDLTQAQAQLEGFRKQLEKMNLAVSPTFTKPIEQSFAKINKTKLSPQVNSTGFQGLNKEIENSIDKYNELQQKAKGKGVNATVDANVQSTSSSDVQSLLSQISVLNNSVITPVIDHKPLEELNAHLDLKKKHWDDLNDHFSKNPLRPKVDNGGMSATIEEIELAQEALKQTTQQNVTQLSTKAKELKVVNKEANTKASSSGSSSTRTAAEAVVSRVVSKELTKTFNTQQRLSVQQTNIFTLFDKAVNSFGLSTDKFAKANKKSLLGSIFGGITNYMGQHFLPKKHMAKYN